MVLTTEPNKRLIIYLDFPTMQAAPGAIAHTAERRFQVPNRSADVEFFTGSSQPV